MDDQTPATKGDLHALEKGMRSDLHALEKGMKSDLHALEKGMNERFERVDEKFRWLHEDIGRVLDVVTTIDKHLQGKLDDHEIRINRLEKSIV